MRSRAIFLAIVLVASAASRPVFAQGPTPAAPAIVGDLQALLRQSRELENNDPPRACQCAGDALALARRQGDQSQLLAALLQAASTARGAAAYPDADALASEGLALATRAGDEAIRGEFLVVRGTVKWNLADLPAATANFLEARVIAEKLDRDDLRIRAEDGLGLAYEREDDHAEAMVYFERALALAERRQDPRLSSILNHVGNACLTAREYPRARGYFERALALIGDGSNQRLVAYIWLNLGEIADRQGDQALAARYLADAMALSTQYGLTRGLADAHYLLARVERNEGHAEVAAQHLTAGMELAAKLGNPDLLASYYEELALTREAQGNYPEALVYARKLAEKTSEIRGERSRQKMTELQARYELEARNRQIKLLQRDAELRSSTHELQTAEYSRTLARYSAGAEIVVFALIIAALWIARQRSRARRAARTLAEVSAAKTAVEETAALKSRLLDIASHHLTESEALFRDAFAHSPLGLALVSLEGKWLRVNEALCHILGYSEGELCSVTFQALTHPEDLAADLDLVAQLLRGERETYHLDKRYLHREGHVVWCRLDVYLHRDAAGEPRHFISQVQDITEQRRAGAQLLQAKDEAEMASAAKNEFLSRMSHELRTPLNAILGFGQLLELQDLGSAHNQGVSYILTAGRHLLSLINEVLDLSSIESGKFSFNPEPTPVPDLLATTLEMMRPLAAEADVRLALEPCPNASTILADPRRLKQVLLNLISNAIKYNRPRGEVVVSCRETEEHLQILVRDTGPGIAAADTERIFAPFARLPGTLEVPGTGLGLSLSRALTETMGGTLLVRSEPGVGSTFTLEFVRVERQALPLPMIDGRTPRPAPRPNGSPAGRRRKVLYIEDDLGNLELIKSLLERDKSIHLVTATRGGSGLELARTERPDIVLLDMHLPDMNGAEILGALRGDPATAEMPVVVVSADALGNQIERMRELGAQAYLTKPINLEELRRTIDETRPAGVPN